MNLHFEFYRPFWPLYTLYGPSVPMTALRRKELYCGPEPREERSPLSIAAKRSMALLGAKRLGQWRVQAAIEWQREATEEGLYG